jgi:hypothetical protein
LRGAWDNYAEQLREEGLLEEDEGGFETDQEQDELRAEVEGHGLDMVSEIEFCDESFFAGGSK